MEGLKSYQSVMEGKLVQLRSYVVQEFRLGRTVASLAQELEVNEETVLRELIDDYLHYTQQIEHLLTGQPELLYHLALARLLEILCSHSVSDKNRLTAIKLVLQLLPKIEGSESQEGLSALRALLMSDSDGG
jgi:hypothetical protein